MTALDIIGLALFGVLVVWPLLTYVGDFVCWLLRRGR